jgi:high-affinity Fe2+/Pb2+ permease
MMYTYLNHLIQLKAELEIWLKKGRTKRIKFNDKIFFLFFFCLSIYYIFIIIYKNMINKIQKYRV